MKKAEINLIPNTQNTSPDYYCTWQSQLYACSNTGPQGQRDNMCETALFGSGYEPEDTKKGIGWATHQYKEARKDLYLLLDDSWDVPYGEHDNWYGSLHLARDKFPTAYGLARADAFSDDEPIDLELSERAMDKLAKRILDLGWKGMGGWVCVSKAPIAHLKYNGDKVVECDLDNEEYWRERVIHAYNAGWRYWKMDWGRDSGNVDIRRMITEIAHSEAPGMWIEHAIKSEIIPYSDTFRSYDAFTLMAIPLTLDRLSEFFMYETEEGYKGLVNCEDEPYIAAALGCVLGVMRHGMVGNLPNGEPDCSFPALHRNFKTKLTEIIRTVRWHRIAPAFAVSAKNTRVDENRLYETWNVVSQKDEIEAWWRYGDGDKIEKNAPARISRGLELPEVEPDGNGNVPFVISSKNPNGAVSVATLGRTAEHKYFIPRCNVTLDAGDSDTIGAFGFCKALILKSNKTTVLMQDLAGETAYDITNDCIIGNGSITIPGELIAEIGQSCNAEGDTSEPGVVIKLK